MAQGQNRLRTLWLAAGATLAGFALLFWAVAHTLREQMAQAPRFRVQAENIRLHPPPPPWIRRPVVQEVIEHTRWEEPLTVLDAQLPKKLYEAFSLHPWIACVERVQLEAGPRVQVWVQYRKPVLMVEVPGGLFPVDQYGVLLPTEDFTPEQASRFPRLGGIRSRPSGPPGTPWGDPLVQQAATVADTLQDVWLAWGLYRLVPRAKPAGQARAQAAGPPWFEIHTRHGTRILWGPAQGEPDMPSPAQRKALLEQLVRQLGTLDDPQQPRLIDLLAAQAPRVMPLRAQTAGRDRSPSR